MKQNQQFRGIGLVLLVIALITFASSLTSQGSLFSQEMTHQEFMVAVENKTIESVDINQNQQPPTGTLDILLKSGDRAVVAVSDVKEAEKLLQENSIDYIVENVPQENYLMSVIIPVALSAVVIMFMFMFMNARLGGGGGGNSKMMNFGKSRAKMSRTNSVNFSKVAGLEEEKEELEEIVDFLKNPKKYTHAHARAKAESPHHQGLCAMVSVFIDTFIVLNLTVFSVLTTGVMSTGKDGTALTQAAFMKGFGSAGIIFVAVCLFFFAFSTILSWHFFGLVNVKYLFGEKASKLYSLIVVVCIVIGSCLKLELVWSLADFFNGLMVIPNVLALLALSGLVAGASKER